MSSPNAANGGLNRPLITVSIMLATMMQALDMTIANVALPKMMGSLSATVDQIAWVLTSYIVMAAIMTPPTGYFAARFGRKRLFLTSVIGFTLSSMMCGGATSLTEIVVFRLFQGAFGAGLVPLSQAILLDSYPRERHGAAMALWGLGVIVGPIIGPTLGGYLTEYHSWRWVFYINLPVGILASLGILAFVPETQRRPGLPFDFVGFGMLSVGIGALQMMLDRGQTLDWFGSIEIVTEAVLAGLGFYTFIVHMLTAERPFLEPALFKDRNLVVGLVFIFVVGIVLLATMALLPPFLQDLLGYPVLTTGLVLAPRGMGAMVSMFLVGRLISRVSPRLMIFCGLSLTALSLWEMSGFNMDISIWDVVRTGVTQGLGLGLVFVPLTTLAFATLPPHLRNEGTSLFSLTRNIGSSIGISIMVALLARNTQINHASLVEYVTPFSQALKFPAAAHAWSLTQTHGLAAIGAEVTKQAAAIAYLDDFRLMVGFTLAALPLLLLLRSPSRSAPAAGDRPAADMAD